MPLPKQLTMARLVVLSEGYTGRAYELKVEKTTIGRLEDNAFSIPDASISSHHCEVVLQGEEIVVRDLDSTNGSFINGEPITEAVLKSGQILRLGNIDMRLETAVSPADAAKKALDKTRVIPQGVRPGDLERGAGKFNPDTSEFFKKRSNKGTKVFIGVIIVVLVIIVILLAFVVFRLKRS